MLTTGKRGAIEQIFLEGKAAEISLAAENSARSRLTLRAGKDKIVCEHDPAAGRSCRFTPIFTQRYAIEITSGGAE